MANYKVAKDGLAFYVQPWMLDYYASNGYKVYKTVEEEVTNVAAEIARGGYHQWIKESNHLPTRSARP